MANPQKPDVTPEEASKAKELWEKFTVGMKWGIIATVGLLVLLALITL